MCQSARKKAYTDNTYFVYLLTRLLTMLNAKSFERRPAVEHINKKG